MGGLFLMIDNDLRVKKTKRSIRIAYHELLQTKKKEKISVRELVEKAEINRSTFYYYYETITDLHLNLQADFVHTIISSLPIDTFQHDLSDSLKETYNICKKYKIDQILKWNEIETSFLSYLASELEKTLLVSSSTEEERELIKNYYIFIFAGVLELFRNNPNLKPADINRLALILTTPIA